jgi:hypothetical protein
MKRVFAAALAIGGLICLLRPAPGADQALLKPINLNKVNTEADEDDPFLTPSGYQLYYVSNAKGNFNIMVSQRANLNQLWPAGRLVPVLNDDTDSDRRSPFLDRSSKFYFASNALPKDPDAKFEKNFDLYFCVATKRLRFTQPTPVLGVCTAAEELHPWVTAAGKEFYFSRKTKEGWRVFVAQGPAFGAITKPRQLDLPTGFHHPTLSPNALTMYLQGPLEKDRWGLFRTTRPRVGGTWGKPVELAGLNSPEAPRGDMSPNLSADGRKLYFASDRPGGKGGLDLWMIPVAKLAKKKEATTKDTKSTKKKQKEE